MALNCAFMAQRCIQYKRHGVYTAGVCSHGCTKLCSVSLLSCVSVQVVYSGHTCQWISVMTDIVVERVRMPYVIMTLSRVQFISLQYGLRETKSSSQKKASGFR